MFTATKILFLLELSHLRSVLGTDVGGEGGICVRLLQWVTLLHVTRICDLSGVLVCDLFLERLLLLFADPLLLHEGSVFFSVFNVGTRTRHDKQHCHLLGDLCCGSVGLVKFFPFLLRPLVLQPLGFLLLLLLLLLLLPPPSLLLHDTAQQVCIHALNGKHS
jgi:hypothetical protein